MSAAPRYICIHGHFYQPPRENPWLEAIELQDSAYPHHDWNERVADECYRANARSRVLDAEGRICRIVNNYARLSFNFGPTLLSWLEHRAPDAYDALLEADRASADRFDGHGSALSQAYGHVIMPLADERDRRTQVIWGIRDFEHRFRRPPEGMWLPETAVDTATLEVLAEQDIRFTVLAPRQARRVRSRRGGRWADASGGVDPTRAYLVRLPSGRSISVFFYDGPISQAIAFEHLLHSGRAFADRLVGGFDDSRDWPQLMHVATDGETYGHHHGHGDMALAAALDDIEARPGVELINYGAFLARHPPTHFAEIVEGSSWSCVHGLERWRSDCGCHTGGQPGWSQAWRAPLREALDWLRDTVAPAYEQAAGELLHDPWAARDDYVSVLLDRSPERIDGFMDGHGRRPLERAERVRVLKLLELQRHAMLMYTSCGWFFNELSGIETVQVIQYAGRLIQLAEDVFGRPLEGEFLGRLERARSNLPDQGNGRDIYLRFVKPAMIDLAKVGGHYALSSLFEEYGETTNVYCYDVELRQSRRAGVGRAGLHVGQTRITSRVTLESDELSFAVLHLGEHMMNGVVGRAVEPEALDRIADRLTRAFGFGDFTDILHMLEAEFGGPTYTLASLFRDEQRKVVRLILQSTLEEVEGTYRSLYEKHGPLTRFLGRLRIPAPRALHLPAEFVINAWLREALEAETPDVARIGELLRQAEEQAVQLDPALLRFAAVQVVRRLACRLPERVAEPEQVAWCAEVVGLLRLLPFAVELDELQNAYYELCLDGGPRRAAAGHEASVDSWIEAFARLGEQLNVHVPPAAPAEPQVAGPA